MYNKSEIMKRAWAEAKNKPVTIKGSEIKKGDTLHFEYGDYDCWVTAQVIGIKDEMLYGNYVVEAISLASKSKFDFCIKPNETIEKLAV